MLHVDFAWYRRQTSARSMLLVRQVTSPMKNRVTTFIAPLGLALALATPVTGWTQGVAGPYLAATQAENRGDVAAAARLFSRTLARDPNNVVVMERAMVNQIAAGNVAEGVALARRFEDLRPGHHLGVLALAGDGLRDGRFAEVRELLTEGGPFVGQVVEAWAAYGDDDLDTARAQLNAMIEGSENGLSGQLIASYHLGLIEAAAGNDDLALEAMTRAADMTERESVRMTAQRASAMARLGRVEDGIALIREKLQGTYGSERLSALAVRLENGDIPSASLSAPAVGAADVFNGASVRDGSR